MSEHKQSDVTFRLNYLNVEQFTHSINGRDTIFSSNSYYNFNFLETKII